MGKAQGQGDTGRECCPQRTSSTPKAGKCSQFWEGLRQKLLAVRSAGHISQLPFRPRRGHVPKLSSVECEQKSTSAPICVRGESCPGLPCFSSHRLEE